MKKTDENSVKTKKQRSYNFYLFITVFLIALFIIILSISAGFMYSENLIRNQAEISQNEVSERIIFDTKLVNAGLDMYDTSLNNRVEAYFQYFIEEYKRSGNDPDSMDLLSVAGKSGKGVSLYIINESYVITHATNPDSIGLDFKKYSPYYIPYLEKIRTSEGGFFPERVMTEKETGLQKKFGYMATPDNRYILEISLYDEEFNNVRKELKYSDKIEEISEKSPYVKSVRIFNTMKKPVGNTDYTPSPEYLSLLEGIFASETGIDVKDPETGETLRYLYVPLKSDKYGSDNSLIVELGLDNGPLNMMRDGIFIQYLIIGIFSIAMCIAFSVLISRHFSGEIEGIVKDISIISDGDLKHKIRDSKVREFKNLEDSINQMIEKIRENIEKYKESQATLKIERDRAKTYFDLAGVIFIASERDGTIKDINKKALEILEYSKEEVTDKNFFDLVFTDNNREKVKNLFNEDIESHNSRPFDFSCRIKTKTGKIRDVNLSTVILKDKNGNIISLLTTGTDITDELAIKKELESSLNQKSVLLSEVHHRVKNNLQIIISLFELESYVTDDKNLLRFLNESKSRINSMALVHEIMYRSENFIKVNIPDYTRSIVSETFSCYMPDTKINVDYDMDEVFFDLDHSVPYGLLLNELVSNSVLHAFTGRDNGIISIYLKRKDDKSVVLTYKDDGCGLPSDEVIKKKRTIGFNLISGLTSQLSGKMQIIRERGTTFIIEMEIPKEQPRF